MPPIAFAAASSAAPAADRTAVPDRISSGRTVSTATEPPELPPSRTTVGRRKAQIAKKARELGVSLADVERIYPKRPGATRHGTRQGPSRETVRTRWLAGEERGMWTRLWIRLWTQRLPRHGATTSQSTPTARAHCRCAANHCQLPSTREHALVPSSLPRSASCFRDVLERMFW